MDYRIPNILAALCAICLTAAAFLACGLASDAMASSAPNIQQASEPPTFMAYLLPGQEVTPPRAIRDREAGRPCFNTRTGRRGYFSDVQAYHWDGRGFAPQRWDDDLPGWYWQPKGWKRAVWYDGLTFGNATRHPVLVAGWCESALTAGI